MNKVELENKIQQLEEKLERKQDRLADVLHTRHVLKNENETLRAQNDDLLAKSLKFDHVVRHVRGARKILWSESPACVSPAFRNALLTVSSAVSNDYLNDLEGVQREVRDQKRTK